METLRVAKTSSISAVAGAIAKYIREDGKVVVQSVGNDTLTRSVKAIVLATQYMAEEKIVIASLMEFFGVSESVTGIKITVMIVGKLVDVLPTEVITK